MLTFLVTCDRSVLQTTGDFSQSMRALDTQAGNPFQRLLQGTYYAEIADSALLLSNMIYPIELLICFSCGVMLK